MDSDKFYIQNKKKGYLGNAIFFWAKGCNGYTVDLNKAHIFTKKEAEEICNGNPAKNKMWSVEYIDNNKGIQRIVDSQYLNNYQVNP